MANSLFNQFQPRQTNQMQMLNQLRNDPVGVLKQSGYNIPAGMNNPRQIIQHLIQSGQVGNGRLAQIQQMARSMMR